MAVELLRYANRAKVAEALTAQGYEVTRMTVNRWARGDEMPAIAARMIVRLFGHEHEEAPPPLWAEAMEQRLLEAVERNGQLIGGLVLPADLVEAAQRVIERLEALQPPSDEAPPGSSGVGGPAFSGRRDPGPG